MYFLLNKLSRDIRVGRSKEAKYPSMNIYRCKTYRVFNYLNPNFTPHVRTGISLYTIIPVRWLPKNLGGKPDMHTDMLF